MHPSTHTHKHSVLARYGAAPLSHQWPVAEFFITSISPQEGSFYGLTPLTITGRGFEDLNPDGLHVRIGPAITALDDHQGMRHAPAGGEGMSAWQGYVGGH